MRRAVSPVLIRVSDRPLWTRPHRQAASRGKATGRCTWKKDLSGGGLCQHAEKSGRHFLSHAIRTVVAALLHGAMRVEHRRATTPRMASVGET